MRKLRRYCDFVYLKKMKSVLVWFVLLSAIIGSSNAYKILGVFPTVAKSHHIVGSSLMKGLAERGHDVTVISPFPLHTPLKNYRDIPLATVLEKGGSIMNNIMDKKVQQQQQQSIIELFRNIFGLGIFITNCTFEDPEVKKFLSNRNEKFDLVITEIFVNEAIMGFGQHFKAPVIGVSTFGASLWTCDLVGSPSPLSYVPNTFLTFTDHMTLVQRVGNLAISLFERIYFDFFYMPRQNAIYDQVFSNPKPSLEEIRKNVSLVLLNSHVSVGYPRPYMPNMIEVGGMHINGKPKALPADLQQYLDTAKEGVVYFSMGSNLKSKMIRREKLDHLINTFKSLKQKVLWKWEDDNLPGKSDNIYISKWFPQDDILAHPNLKLFITHGGLLSTTEAIYHAVPVIGIPIFGDQFLNMARIVKSKMGLMIKYDELTYDTLKPAINEILNNNRYDISVKANSQRYRDQPMNPLDTAIYWVEYISRHKGAPHLRSGAQDLSFIAYHNLDAIAIVSGGVFLILYLLVAMIMKLFTCGRSSKKIEKKKKQ